MYLMQQKFSFDFEAVQALLWKMQSRTRSFGLKDVIALVEENINASDHAMTVSSLPDVAWRWTPLSSFMTLKELPIYDRDAGSPI